MRPITLNSGIVGNTTYYYPIIVPDVMLTPGNASWIVRLVGTVGASTAATVSLYFSNEDPFAPNIVLPSNSGTPNPGSPLWIQETAAFQNASGAAVATATLNTTTRGAVGAYAYLPRMMLFALTSCTSSPNINVDFVQASGGIG